MKTIEVPGRHGALHVTNGTYKPEVKSVEIALEDSSRIHTIFAWLTGSGDVVFSNEPRYCYRGIISNKIPLDRVIREVKKGLVQFQCQPFQYDRQPSPITMTEPGIITNLGTVPSQPIITIYGAGEIEISINNRSFLLSEINDFVVVDSEIQNAYRERNQLWNRKMTGEFPFFDVGENRINWRGVVKKIFIQPEWRRL